MPDKVIPEDVKLFILEYIDSIAHLEALLLLRANPQSGRGAADVAERLYISQKESESLLNQLQDKGLVIRDGNTGLYFYKPETPVLDVMVDRLSDVYKRYLLPVTNFIHSKPKSRLQEFANAFRIRKD